MEGVCPRERMRPVAQAAITVAAAVVLITLNSGNRQVHHRRNLAGSEDLPGRWRPSDHRVGDALKRCWSFSP